VLTLGGFAVFGKSLKSDVSAWLWENQLFLENVAALVVRRNISLTINIVLSEIVADFGAVVRIQ